MQFALIETEWGIGPIDKSASLYIACVAIALIIHFFSMLFRNRRLRRLVTQLGKISPDQFAAGKWDSTVSSWSGVNDPQFLSIIEILRQELSGQGPLAVISVSSQALDILAERLIRSIRRMQTLGWSACLAAWIGALSIIQHAFRGIAIVGYAKGLDGASVAFYAALRLLTGGLIVGLACLALSSFYKSRLHLFHWDLSRKIFIASAKKGAPAL